MTVTPLRRRLLDYAAEADLARYVADTGRAFGWRRYHTFDARRSAEGFPDEVLVHPAWQLTVFAELKGWQNLSTRKPHMGEPEVEQLEWLADLRAAGQFAYLWTPLDVDLIDAVLMRGDVADLPPLPPPSKLALARQAARHKARARR